jgi:hypothetical protein
MYISVFTDMSEDERNDLFQRRRLEMISHSLVFSDLVFSLVRDYNTAGASTTFFDVRENLNNLLQAIEVFV